MNVNGFLDKNPFVRIILPFILGIILHRYADIPAWLSCMVLCSFLAFAIILNRDSEYKKRWMCGAMLFVSILALGSASATLSAPRNIAADTGGRKCEYRACVTNTPQQQNAIVL